MNILNEIEIQEKEDIKRINIVELEEMLGRGETPPDIQEIDDLPKEEFNVQLMNLNEQRPKKPWEKEQIKDKEIN